MTTNIKFVHTSIVIRGQFHTQYSVLNELTFITL